MNSFRKLIVLTFFIQVFTAAAVYAQDPVQAVMVTPEIALQMTIPETGWTVSKDAPQYLVDEAIADVKQDLEKAGKTATDEQILAQVKKRLGSNELYIYNPASKATLQIDFSPLGKGETAPSKKTVKASAKAAGESMASEGGVSGAQYRVTKTQVEGVDVAYRLDLIFKTDGAMRQFIGLVGFTEGNWLFFYYTDRLVVPEDYGQMETILASLAVKSYAKQLAAGEDAFTRGDFATALEIFTPLADQGVAKALYYIGFMHMKGDGVPQDHKVAAEWYRKAAEKGSVIAQNNLGFVYAKGDHGLPQDNREAAKWYRMAAENGDVAAQYNIGRMYYEGTGVDKDPVMAYAFSAWAVEGGDKNAGEYLQRAEKEMSSEQLERAKHQLELLKNKGTQP